VKIIINFISTFFSILILSTGLEKKELIMFRES